MARIGHLPQLYYIIDVKCLYKMSELRLRLPSCTSVIMDSMNQFPAPQFTPEGIAYYRFGRGQDTLLFVHGSFGSAMIWQRLIPHFVRAGFSAVALDLQGHGQSKNFELAKSGMDDYAENVKSVIRAIGNRPILVGHSMSGLVVLMVVADLPQITTAVAIDPSPTKEVQGTASASGIPDIYTAQEVGMPATPEEMMAVMPDIEPEMLEGMAAMLSFESGAARRQRKLGISIPKEKLDSKQILFLGAEHGDSLPFGIPAASTKAMAEYYRQPYFEVAGASHPGMLIGKSSDAVAKMILEWVRRAV